MRTHPFFFLIFTLSVAATGWFHSASSESLFAQGTDVKSAQPPASRLSSPLRRAIQRGLAQGGDLAKELLTLDDLTISVRRDAEAVVNALATQTPQQLIQRTKENDNNSAFYLLTSCFENCELEESAAYKVFQEKGIPELLKAYDAIIALNQVENEEDLIYALKIMAHFQSKEGAQRIVEATRRPLAPDSYWWNHIFSELTNVNPIGESTLRAIRAPLPDERIAAKLLSEANELMLTDSISDHPFDTPAGHKQLEEWLVQTPPKSAPDEDYEENGRALDATVALAFINSDDRERLLKTAMKNESKDIQLEAAWAAAKAKFKFGTEALAEFCKDVHYAAKAKDYLEELEKKDAIPEAALEPNFAAKAEFSRWLQHPNELADIPDELEIVDQRELPWPPSGDMKKVWLIRYAKKDTTGLESDDVDIGMVGPMTWCFFYYDCTRRPIEDVYAIYAYFECKNQDLIQESYVEETLDPEQWLRQWKGEPLTDAEFILTISANGELNLRNHNLALASAKLNGEEGWVVFDGPRTRWYPKSEQPADEVGDYNDSVILEIHLGRQLLQLPLDANNRKEFLNNGPKQRTPEEIVAAYEKLIDEFDQATTTRQVELLASYGELQPHFDSYVSSVVKLKDADKTETTITLYEKLIDKAAKVKLEDKEDIYGSYSALGRMLETYSQILIERNRQADVIQLIKTMEPYRREDYNYSELGIIAFKAGDHALAESILSKVLDTRGVEDYLDEEVAILAEIWKGKGELKKGQQLMLESLKQIKRRIAESEEYPEARPEFIREYKVYYEKFLELYPDGNALLDEARLPADPSQKK